MRCRLEDTCQPAKTAWPRAIVSATYLYPYPYPYPGDDPLQQRGPTPSPTTNLPRARWLVIPAHVGRLSPQVMILSNSVALELVVLCMQFAVGDMRALTLP